MIRQVTGADGDQWLDTEASPGGIAISQDVELATGQTAQLKLIVTWQDVDQFDSNEVLHVVFNGTEVGTITEADLESSDTF